MRALFCTLGCKANQADSGSMAALLRAGGHEILTGNGDCDAVVVNTCAVTALAGQKSRRALRSLRARYPDAVLAVCGCLPAAEAFDCPEADLIGGAGRRAEFIRALETLTAARAAGQRPAAAVVTAAPGPEFERLPAAASDGRTRAYLKIQDGCDNRCSYCVIPRTRGAARSLPPEQAVREAEGLRNQGFRELVLTGIEISSYQPGLCDLLERLAKALPDMRLRLGSLEPSLLTAETAGRLGRIPGLCPHFHLSLQSGCDTVLRRMNRKYGTAEFTAAVTRLRERFDNPAVTTDLICGFPGETEEEFVQTLAFLEQTAFAQTHIFPYSRRPGTPAASLPNQLSRAEKTARAARAAEVSQNSMRLYRESMIGRTLEVLFEGDGHAPYSHGHSGNYLPVRVETGGLQGTLRRVLITAADGTLTGQLV